MGLPDRNLKRQVTDSEVVGTWKMTADSLALLKRDGFKSDPSHTYTITFNADGTLAFDSVKDDNIGGHYMAVPGEWSLDYQPIEIEVNTLRIELKRKDASHFFTLCFDEVGGELVLWSFYGDPDSWEFIEYKRVP